MEKKKSNTPSREFSDRKNMKTEAFTQLMTQTVHYSEETARAFEKPMSIDFL